MLDRVKVLHQVSKQMPSIWKNSLQEVQRARSVWQRLLADTQFLNKLMQLTGIRCNDVFDRFFQLFAHDHPYSVYSVDGSQIYPDRHRGLSCGLINIGSVWFEYEELSRVFWRLYHYLF